MKIGIFYSFETQKTARCARMIKDNFGKEYTIDMIDVLSLDEKTFLSYDKMILGVPTWFDGELPNYWDEFMPAIESLKLKDKKVALFGLGDQKGYPENFVDAIGLMAVALEKRGAEIIGHTSIEGYKFERSKAKRNNIFLGLVLDIENQSGLTNERIAAWVEQLKNEF